MVAQVTPEITNHSSDVLFTTLITKTVHIYTRMVYGSSCFVEGLCCHHVNSSSMLTTLLIVLVQLILAAAITFLLV